MSKRVTVDGKSVRRYDGEWLLETDTHVLVSAERTSCINGNTTNVVAVFERCKKDDGTILLNLCNGVTGFECWEVTKDFLDRISKSGLQACAGTAMQWDELYISVIETKQLLNELMLHRGQRQVPSNPRTL